MLVTAGSSLFDLKDSREGKISKVAVVEEENTLYSHPANFWGVTSLSFHTLLSAGNPHWPNPTG